MTGLLQLNPHIPVATPLGDGDAVLVIDYGHEVNSVWVVRLAGGIVKHFWSDDIRLVGNPMNGSGWDLEIPPAWPTAAQWAVSRAGAATAGAPTR